MSEFSERLQKALEDAEMKPAELSRLTGISKSTISRYLSGGYVPKQKRTDLLARALRVDPGYLITGVKPGKEAPDFDPSTLPSYIPIEKKKIPLLGTIAAGQPIEAIEHVEEWLPVDDDIRADFALRVSGDSMINADIEDGDIVFIRQQPEVMDGQIAAVLIDDDATLKRFYKRPDGVLLVAENPAYQPMFFNADNCDECRILGLAVAKLSRFKY